MNNEGKEAVLHHLQEAAIHLKTLAKSIEEGKIDVSSEAIELGIRLGHIQEHICIAWHSRDGALTNNDEAAYLVPNFGFSFSLVDP